MNGWKVGTRKHSRVGEWWLLGEVRLYFIQCSEFLLEIKILPHEFVGVKKHSPREKITRFTDGR